MLGQPANITERSGTGASSGWVASTAPRNRYLAALDRLPEQARGAGLGLALFAVASIFVPGQLRRRLGLSLRAFASAFLALFAVKPSACSPAFPRRLRLPGLFWRFASYSTALALLFTDPRLDFWSLRAECTYPVNDSNDTTRVTKYSYDFDGRLTRVNGPEGVINYEYELATGRHIRTCSLNSEISYQYDALGRLWKVNVLKRNGATLSQPETTIYAYTPVGNRSTVTLPNGIISAWVYDSLNRLTNLTHKLGGTNLISSYCYQLHPTGRRTNAVEILKIPDSEGGGYLTNTLSWAYDQMYRLTNEVSVSSAAANAGTFTNSFKYDKVGNRWSCTHYQNGTSTTVTNLYNANDQLIREVTLSGGSATSTNWYAYDSNGSVTGKTNISSNGSTVLYGYDLKNKLSSATTVGSGATNLFAYDIAGIRVRSWSSLGGSPTYYLVDENNRTGYAQILEELTGFGSSTTRSYVIGDDVIAQGTSSASYLLHDGHGSTRQVASAAAAVTSRYNFDAYGQTLSTSSGGTPETSLLYCGEQYDSGLGMCNLRARYYNPNNGRFNQRDSFAGHNEDPQSLHKYAYANCDPVNGSDPSGLMTMGEILVVSLIVGIMAGIALPTIAYQYQRNHYPPGLLGTFVHSVISAWYNLRYPGVITNQAIAAGINNDRPDIRFPPGFSDPLLVGEVYEIKPEGRQAEAVSDLAYYITELRLNQSFVPWRTGTLAPPPGTLYFERLPMLTIHTRLAGPGVILYALGPNWNRVSALAAIGFVAGFVATYLALTSGGSGAAAGGEKIIQIKELIEGAGAGGLKAAA